MLRMIVEELRRGVVVAAVVLVVALAHGIVEVLTLVLGVYIAYKTLPSALRADGLLLSVSCDPGSFKGVSVIVHNIHNLHDSLNLWVVFCDSVIVPYIR